MSLRFCIGGSGAGKSTQLYKEMIARSMEEPSRNFLVIVPDQFTMQTQKELVTLHERGGILNIDVLSFGRLAHRIFEETGKTEIPVLDDTGKSLVLRKVAAKLKDKLPVLGGNLDKQGYIHEVKSAISEFMQYGIGTGDVNLLIEFAGQRGALKAKLADLQVLYKGFLSYIQGEFITTEETLDVLCEALKSSKIVKDSVVVFDGFTGFTPIQYKVIQALLSLCVEVVAAVTIDVREPVFQIGNEQQLFYLSRKTISDLCKLSEEAGIPRGKDIILGLADSPNRFTHNAPLSHLEQNLFRYPVKPFLGKQEVIHIFEASVPREEIRQAGILIRKLMQEKGYCYRDFAVITGDLEAYGEHLETEFALLDIPCYVDRTRGIILNPFIEYIKSALKIIERDYSYESIFQYLRSGLADFRPSEVDILENYIIQTGIRGSKRWNRLFTHRTGEMGDEGDALERINEYRQRLTKQLAPLQTAGKRTAEAYVKSLYTFLTDSRTAQKLAGYESLFVDRQDMAKAKEYAQIYRLVMELLEQIIGLLGTEEMTMKEFADILEAGFDEIEVGTIPQNVDRVLAGDMERTRLKEVKVLFFLGVNDGNIPKNTGKGGIISDIDREFLIQSQLSLAPSPRQQMYIQRLYLYLNMTKPSERLYLSFARVSGEGKSLRPAYLIDVIRKLFPEIAVTYPESLPAASQIMTYASGEAYLAKGLRSYVQNEWQGEEDKNTFMTLYAAYGQQEEDWLTRITEAAFLEYENKGLGKAVARALYGQILHNSVSRLETYAACAYAHFLEYGLSLREREEFGFETVDMGNMFHGVLETFSHKLEESEYTWFDFPAEYGEQTVRESVEALAAEYGDTILYSSARNEYAIRRMERILLRTVKTLQYQLQKGSFTPGSYELSFSQVYDLDSVNIVLSEEEKIQLRGRIDRIDTCEDDSRVYVKVVDYKSGNRQFDLVALYYGLQLQLVVYLNAAMDRERRKHPDKEIIPAALLYYHVADPAVETEADISPEELNARLVAELRADGVVNREPEIAARLDKECQGQGKSDVIPVEYKKDGSFTARSSVMSTDELHTVSDYVNRKMRTIGREILQGSIEVNPYENGGKSACTYCAYRAVCGFDQGIKGYHTRKLPAMSSEEAMEAIKKAAEGNQ